MEQLPAQPYISETTTALLPVQSRLTSGPAQPQFDMVQEEERVLYILEPNM